MEEKIKEKEKKMKSYVSLLRREIGGKNDERKGGKVKVGL